METKLKRTLLDIQSWLYVNGPATSKEITDFIKEKELYLPEGTMSSPSRFASFLKSNAKAGGYVLEPGKNKKPGKWVVNPELVEKPYSETKAAKIGQKNQPVSLKDQIVKCSAGKLNKSSLQNLCKLLSELKESL